MTAPGRPTLAEWIARYDAAQAARGDGRLSCALEGRPYQEAPLRALLDPETTGVAFVPGLGKTRRPDYFSYSNEPPTVGPSIAELIESGVLPGPVVVTFFDDENPRGHEDEGEL